MIIGGISMRTFLGTLSVLLLLMGSGGSRGYLIPLLIGLAIIVYLVMTMKKKIIVNGVRVRRIK
jgi:hypothetical protein